MNDNKNRLREDAIEFAIQISDLCDEIKQTSKDLLQECGVIRRMLVKSITTAKENLS